MTQLPPPASTTEPIPSQLTEGEVSLIDTVRFLRRHYRLMGGLTLLAIVAGLWSSLSKEPAFERKMLFEFEITPLLTTATPSIAADSDTTEADLKTSLMAQGVIALEGGFSEEIGDSGVRSNIRITAEPAAPPMVNTTTLDHLLVTITADEMASIEQGQESALSALQKVAVTVTQAYLAEEIERLDVLIQRSQGKITFIEEQLKTQERLLTGTNGTENLISVLRGQPQQEVLAEELGDLANYEFSRQSFTTVLANGREDLVMISVVEETERQDSQNLLAQILLSAIAGFIVSILIAVTIDQIPQIRKALSES